MALRRQRRQKKRNTISRRKFLKIAGGLGIGAVSASLIRQPVVNVAAQTGSPDYTVSSAGELQDAVSSADPGQEIVARSGTYDMSGRWRITNGGEPDNPVLIRAADGETPHIQFEAGQDNPTEDSGIQFRSPHVVFRGFEVSDSGWKGVNAGGDAHDVVFENLDVHHCNLWGIMNNGNENVVFRNCDAHDIWDPQNSGQHSDGLNMAHPDAANGLIEGCRAWNCGDDGYDLWTSENHTVRYCWAWNNGRGGEGNGNGFKLGSSDDLGGGGHLVHHCVSFNNRDTGFWWNGETNNPIEVYNCTAWNNPVNFAFRDIGHILKNNLSYAGYVPGAGVVAGNSGPYEEQCDGTTDAMCGVDIGSPVEQANNSWQRGITNPRFQSTDPDSDNFLRLQQGSPAVNAGTTDVPDEVLEHTDTQPDLGAFERGMDTPLPGTVDAGGTGGRSSTGGQSSSNGGTDPC